MSVEDYIKQIDEYIEKRGKLKDYDKDHLLFDLSDCLRDIEDKQIKVKVALHYIDKIKEMPSLTDLILTQTPEEQKDEVINAYKKNGIYIDANVYKVDSIEMKIAETAAKKWGESDPKNLVEAKKITGGSEVSAVRGIISALNLNEEDEKYLLDDVYNSTQISEYIAQEINNSIGDNKNEKILKILSTIHDDWVTSKADNFMKPGRNKERQFVPLEMLNWGEVESDLLFLKPILEAAGVEISDVDLKLEFEEKQKQYLEENSIYSHESLVKYLMKGSKSYPALENLATTNGGYIDELLQKPEIVEKMAEQIESVVFIYNIEMAQKNFENEIENKVEEKVIEKTELAPETEQMQENEEEPNEIIEEKASITSKNIADADKQAVLTTKEVGFWGKIINKFKQLFKGKGEK